VKRTIYFGPPGTGKTHTLLERLEEALKANTPVERIAFLTFTRRARYEAVARVEKALGIVAKDLPYFRTIHSMAFRALELQNGDVLGHAQLKEFGDALGLEFSEVAASEQAAEGIYDQSKGNHLLAIDNLARLRGKAPREIWRDAASPYDWIEVEHFLASYHTYKRDRGLLDFTDVLQSFVKSNIRLPVDVSFVDEAQDLSPLQWYAALQACEGCHTQYVAGDDDQCIYRWAGAEVEVFQQLPGDRQVLHQSYRLPRVVHALADKVLQRIKHRVPKQFAPRPVQGRIAQHANNESLEVKPGQSWLWLVRNRYLLGTLRLQLEQQGIVYSQHGNSSITDADRDAIYAWERLRAGRQITVLEARDLYKKLKTRLQVKHGHKLIQGAQDEEQVDLDKLRQQHGLLIQGSPPWFQVLETISVDRRGYYRRLLRKHNSLKLAPQVVLETIHGAKGAQADYVALFLEQARRTYDEAQRPGPQQDDEHRVQYVGVTRAREELHVVGAGSRYAYQLPRV
jgi:DNA helicase II / ATP-dependent DNA helicase PcrA